MQTEQRRESSRCPCSGEQEAHGSWKKARLSLSEGSLTEPFGNLNPLKRLQYSHCASCASSSVLVSYLLVSLCVSSVKSIDAGLTSSLVILGKDSK